MVYVLVCKDRHVDDVIEVHTRREAAIESAQEWLDSFDDIDEWESGDMYWFSPSGDYSAEIQAHEVKP
jgi:hypothetical protein